MTNKYSENNYIYKSNIFLLDHKLFLVILAASLFYLFKNPVINVLGTISILAIFLFSIYDFFYRSNKIEMTQIWFWFFMLCFYSIIALLITPTYNAVESLIVQLLLFLYICLFSSSYLNEKVISKFFNVGKIIAIVISVLMVLVIASDRPGVSMFNNYFSPVMYKILIPTSFFFLASSKYKFLKVLIFSILFFLVSERTSAFVLIIIYITYITLTKIKHSKFLYKTLFIITSLIVLAIPYLYVKIQYTDLGTMLTNLSREYTGSNFFSGRNTIWEIAFNYISHSPISGHGIDNEILTMSGIHLSAHNTYIHLALQGGIISVSIFIIFMYSIWKKLYEGLDNELVRMSAAYLIGILVFVSFEVTLLGNTMVTSLFLWLILGIGLVKTNSLKVKF